MSLEAIGESAGPSRRDEIEELYHSLLHALYENENQEAALRLSAQVEDLLASSPELDDSIRGEELRSLVAEARGNLLEAISRRENEIRKILELHSLTQGTPGWDYALKKYDFSDISDRMDL